MPIVVHAPAPEGELWNSTPAMPDPASTADAARLVDPRRTPPPAGVTTDAVGAAESSTNVRMAVLVFPARSAACTTSVGELVVPAVHEKAPDRNGPPSGVDTVWPTCDQPVAGPVSAGKLEEAGPDSPSATAFENCRLPATTPR